MKSFSNDRIAEEIFRRHGLDCDACISANASSRTLVVFPYPRHIIKIGGEAVRNAVHAVKEMKGYKSVAFRNGNWTRPYFDCY